MPDVERRLCCVDDLAPVVWGWDHESKHVEVDQNISCHRTLGVMWSYEGGEITSCCPKTKGRKQSRTVGFALMVTEYDESCAHYTGAPRSNPSHTVSMRSLCQHN